MTKEMKAQMWSVKRGVGVLAVRPAVGRTVVDVVLARAN